MRLSTVEHDWTRLDTGASQLHLLPMASLHGLKTPRAVILPRLNLLIYLLRFSYSIRTQHQRTHTLPIPLCFTSSHLNCQQAHRVYGKNNIHVPSMRRDGNMNTFLRPTRYMIYHTHPNKLWRVNDHLNLNMTDQRGKSGTPRKKVSKSLLTGDGWMDGWMKNGKMEKWKNESQMQFHIRW